jgi:hypothetical protein
MSQYSTGGPVSAGQQFPVPPAAAHANPQGARGQQGTPLGRIFLGVFLALMAWTVVMAVLGLLLLNVVANDVEDAFNDAGFDTSSNTTGLSDECKAWIDGGGLAAESVDCSNDDTALILEYQATK